MGKRVKPTARNSGMEINAILRYGSLGKKGTLNEKSSKIAEKTESEHHASNSDVSKQETSNETSTPVTENITVLDELNSNFEDVSPESYQNDSPFGEGTTPDIRVDNSIFDSSQGSDSSVVLLENCGVVMAETLFEKESRDTAVELIMPCKEESDINDDNDPTEQFPHIIHYESLVGLNTDYSTQSENFHEQEGMTKSQDLAQPLKEPSTSLTKELSLNIGDSQFRDLQNTNETTQLENFRQQEDITQSQDVAESLKEPNINLTNELSLNGEDSQLRDNQNVNDKNSDLLQGITPSISSGKRKLPDDVPSSSKQRRVSNGSAGSNTDVAASQKHKFKGPMDLSELIQRKRWEEALPKILSDLDNGVFPSADVVRQLIKDCVLNKRRRSCNPHEFFYKLVSICEKYEDDIERRFAFVLEAIGLVSSANLDNFEMSRDNCYWPMMQELLENVALDAKNKLELEHRNVLSFFTSLIAFIEKLFDIYISNKRNLTLPFIIRICEGYHLFEPEGLRLQNLKKNSTCLINFVLKLQDYKDELQIMMKIVNMLGKHYYRGSFKTKRKEILVDAFSCTLAERNDRSFRVLEQIKNSEFGNDVCFKIIGRRLKELSNFPEKEQHTFLTNMAKTSIIRNSSLNQALLPAQTYSSVLMKKMNNKGETLLHLLCGRASKNVDKCKMSFDEALDIMETEGEATMNIKDYCGNTPLHDAVSNGRVDQLTTMLRRCCDEANQRLLVDALTRTHDGNTPLHLAVETKNKEVITLVTQIVGTNLSNNIYMTNNIGETPLNCTKDEETRQFLLSFYEEAHSWESNFVFPGCSVILSEESVTQVKRDFYLQKLIQLFGKFNEKTSA